MVTDFYATKLGMTQAWTTSGKRLAITRCKADDLPIITSTPLQAKSHRSQPSPQSEITVIEVGLGRRKLSNMKKPLQTKVSNSGFSFGVRSLRGISFDQAAEADLEALRPGKLLSIEQVIQVGDVVQVRGLTRGRGFAGAIKRFGFSGGPKTHGQSDRERAVGSIGAGTFPGRVWKGKKMPGHYGHAYNTVDNLVVVYIDPISHELWLSGPVPGSITTQLRIRKTNKTKQIKLDRAASLIPTDPDVTATEQNFLPPSDANQQAEEFEKKSPKS